MAKVDVVKEIRRAVDTGKVSFGQRESLDGVLGGTAKVVVIANNCPKKFREKISHAAKIAGTDFLDFEENGLELGSVCGKPFNVSAMTVNDFGKSNLGSLFGKEGQKKER